MFYKTYTSERKPCIHKIKLMSNSKQQKRVGMIGFGLEITEYITY
jgi:3,4-dihydroxy 2-butanone 4-phosphate synthase/GTP cyclohydrolase II